MPSQSQSESKSKVQLLINYVPGDECRVAVVENGKLEELHAERAAAVSRVGNIYSGVVANVEASIQAAFIDFGVADHGFLHVTDVHPRYFPGEDDDTTERVGRKTPRRERPPIQKCFRRGDEVQVQVLKEGVGTKGPTLTSYLSIPGRFLVMMPQMDRVGVSRKVEDEDQRRKMREILDQLDLPEGFGFILRTAGMERTKAELKRDLAYLQRLWKDMEARMKGGRRPHLLYSESDLLVRSLRDILTGDVDEVVIDHDQAIARASRFLKIVAPRTKTKLLRYNGVAPLFHAFGVEQQITLIHAREVPLPSGGRLVIDETEALVAIDVNSGKARDARDAETNAYRTNVEAVDEICRQLRLRDLGGIVINDLIDMRHASHRKDIEARFRERMKRDRARSTLLPISEFGILEMTRQRMRGSHESVHFAECPMCRARGLLQRPDSVSADALRELGALVAHDRVAKVEMVVSPRVASELLSARRRLLSRVERASGKHVDVRVSEQVPVDRVAFYAYDGAGADIEIDRLPPPAPPTGLPAWESADKAEDWAADIAREETEAEPVEDEAVELPAHPIEFDEQSPGDAVQPGGAPAEAGGRRKRRRRGRGGRGGGGDGGRGGEAGTQRDGRHAEPAPARSAPPAPHRADRAAPPPRPRPVLGRAGDHGDEEDSGFVGGRQPVMDEQFAPTDGAAQPLGPDGAPAPGAEGPPGEGGRRRRRRRGRRRGRGGGGAPGGPGGPGAPADAMLDGQAPRPLDNRPPPNPSYQRAIALPAAGDHGPEDASPADQGFEPDAGVEPDGAESFDESGEPPGPPQLGPDGLPIEGGPRKRRRRRRRGRGGRGGQGGAPGAPAGAGGEAPAPHADHGVHPSSRVDRPASPAPRAPRADRPPPAPPVQPEPKPTGPRFLYSGVRRKLTPAERARIKPPRE